jgi:hypothetical protein
MPTPKSPDVSPELLAELEPLIMSGHSVAAIKRLREATGVTLADALNWVNEWMEKNAANRLRTMRRDQHDPDPAG